MITLFKYLIYLFILIALIVILYAIFAELPSPLEPISQPVLLSP